MGTFESFVQHRTAHIHISAFSGCSCHTSSAAALHSWASFRSSCHSLASPCTESTAQNLVEGNREKRRRGRRRTRASRLRRRRNGLDLLMMMLMTDRQQRPLKSEINHVLRWSGHGLDRVTSSQSSNSGSSIGEIPRRRRRCPKRPPPNGLHRAGASCWAHKRTAMITQRVVLCLTRLQSIETIILLRATSVLYELFSFPAQQEAAVHEC